MRDGQVTLLLIDLEKKNADNVGWNSKQQLYGLIGVPCG